MTAQSTRGESTDGAVRSKPSMFPDFVRRLPEADIPFPGLRGWILQGPESQLLFLEANVEVDVAEHRHGEQWGFVVAGRMEFTVAGITRTYRRGDSYHIPAGTPHRAMLHPGFRAVDYFADPGRYRPKRPVSHLADA